MQFSRGNAVEAGEKFAGCLAYRNFSPRSARSFYLRLLRHTNWIDNLQMFTGFDASATAQSCTVTTVYSVDFARAHELLQPKVDFLGVRGAFFLFGCQFAVVFKYFCVDFLSIDFGP